MSTLSTKCIFLKKPLETMMMAQTHRSLFVDATLKCPVMSSMLAKKNDHLNLKGQCPFSQDSVLQTLTKGVNRFFHTSQHDNASKNNPPPISTKDTPPSGEGRIFNEEIGKPATGQGNHLNILEDIHHVPHKTAPTPPHQITTELNKQHFKYEQHFNRMIDAKKTDHSYRIFRKVNRNTESFPMADDYTFSDRPHKVTVWCSNDYLGMSGHPAVVSAAKSVIDENGVGAGGTRNISGTSVYHPILEQSLAQWHQKEAGLVFTSCYVANDTALFTLGQRLPGCIIFSDASNHASMIHGIRTSGAEKRIFRHNDVAHLEELLKKADPSVPKIVAFETVYSMSGVVSPLEELCDVAHKYGALTFVDEVHAVGLYGKHGSGIGELHGVLDKMDVISGTLGKAVGCIGGYLAGSASLIDTLRSYGAGFIFTTALPPDKICAALTSVEILKSEEGEILRQRHQENVKLLRTKLLKVGLPVEHCTSHIVPIQCFDAEKCLEISRRLQQEYGIYIQSINYPTVPRGREKLRIAPTPFHTEEMMDELVSALNHVWRDVALPYVHPVCEMDCKCQLSCHNFDVQHVKNFL